MRYLLYYALSKGLVTLASVFILAFTNNEHPVTFTINDIMNDGWVIFISGWVACRGVLSDSKSAWHAENKCK